MAGKTYGGEKLREGKKLLFMPVQLRNWTAVTHCYIAFHSDYNQLKKYGSSRLLRALGNLIGMLQVLLPD